MEKIEKLEKIGILLFLGLNSYTDLKRKEISVPAVSILGLAGLCALFRESRDAGDLFLSLGMGAGFIFLSVLTKGGLGMGDGILILCLGLWMEWSSLARLVVESLLLCALTGVFLWSFWGKGKRTELPFVPFLFLSYVGGLIL